MTNPSVTLLLQAEHPDHLILATSSRRTHITNRIKACQAASPVPLHLIAITHDPPILLQRDHAEHHARDDWYRPTLLEHLTPGDLDAAAHRDHTEKEAKAAALKLAQDLLTTPTEQTAQAAADIATLLDGAA